jgi:hypothetical protein
MSSSKRHFTAVVGSKEHGLYISSSPSSAARKIVSKLCASSKSKKVEFCVREITQGSKKKTYGPYLGEMKKLAKPIELKGRVIRYAPEVHLKKKKTATNTVKKIGKKMRGGSIETDGELSTDDFLIKNDKDIPDVTVKINSISDEPYLFFGKKMIDSRGGLYQYVAYEYTSFRNQQNNSASPASNGTELKEVHGIKKVKFLRNDLESEPIKNIQIDELKKLYEFLTQKLGSNLSFYLRRSKSFCPIICKMIHREIITRK